MIVEHLSFSRSGGAGLVAQTLVTHQRSLGIESSLSTLTDSNLRAKPFRNPGHTLSAALDHYLVASSTSNTMFGLFRRQLKSIDLNKLTADSVVHLHWVIGMVGARELVALLEDGRKIVWTVHDMAPFTGGCHHSHTCNGFEDDCIKCPQVKKAFQEKVTVAKAKEVMPRVYKNLSLVSPTDWMAERIKASSRFRGFHIETIPNPISQVFLENGLQTANHRDIRESDAVTFVSIATDLSDETKGIIKTVKLVQNSQENHQIVARLLLIGANGQKFHNPAKGIHWLGSKKPEEIATIVMSTDWVVSASVAESAGMTVAECGALGVPSIVLNGGGISEMMIHGETGFLAQTDAEFASYMKLAISKTVDWVSMSAKARGLANRKFNPDVVARQYMAVYARDLN